VARPVLKTVLWFFLLSGTLYSVSFLAAFTNTGAFNHRFQLEIMQTVIWVGAFLRCLPFLIELTRNTNDIAFGVLANFASDHIKNKQTQAWVFGVFRYITTLIVLFFFSGTFFRNRNVWFGYCYNWNAFMEKD